MRLMPVHALDLFFFYKKRDRWFSVKVSVPGVTINYFYSPPYDTHKHKRPEMMPPGGLNVQEIGFPSIGCVASEEPLF